MEPPIIHSIFTIGRHCAADYLVNDMYIRGYSSPFSWMNIDLETSLHFIKTRFQDFTDVIRSSAIKNENGVYDFTHKNYPFNGWDRICLWSHHDLSDSTVVESLKRRAHRLMSCLNYSSTLLLYYDKIAHPIEFYRSLVDPFTQEYPARILVICPSENEPAILYQSDALCVISGSRGLNRLLNFIYTFNIIPRPTSRSIPQ